MQITDENYKHIHIGQYIYDRWKNEEIDVTRAISFLNCDKNTFYEMFTMESMDTNTLLRWCKLLEYDFFRIYSQHIILFSPPKAIDKSTESKRPHLPVFRKKIYTKEIIEFILELYENGNKTKKEIIDEYGIPKTTLYKWIVKFKK